MSALEPHVVYLPLLSALLLIRASAVIGQKLRYRYDPTNPSSSKPDELLPIYGIVILSLSLSLVCVYVCMCVHLACVAFLLCSFVR
jgi:hypothetical protein